MDPMTVAKVRTQPKKNVKNKASFSKKNIKILNNINIFEFSESNKPKQNSTASDSERTDSKQTSVAGQKNQQEEGEPTKCWIRFQKGVSATVADVALVCREKTVLLMKIVPFQMLLKLNL